MPDRDPRIDPRPGDVLRKRNIERTVTGILRARYEGTHSHQPIITCREVNLSSTRQYHPWPTLNQWRKWAATAEVLKTASDTGPQEQNHV